MNRRELLGAVGGVCGAVTGCLGRFDGPANAGGSAPCPSTPVAGRPTSPIYISGVQANPAGPDGRNLNGEFVFIEMNADTVTDLAGAELRYCQTAVYRLPTLVSAVEPGEGIRIHSGAGDNTTTPSKATAEEYRLYVDSDESLLADDGMDLVLRTDAGDRLDAVQYPGLGPDEVYARPE